MLHAGFYTQSCHKLYKKLNKEEILYNTNLLAKFFSNFYYGIMEIFDLCRPDDYCRNILKIFLYYAKIHCLTHLE